MKGLSYGARSKEDDTAFVAEEHEDLLSLYSSYSVSTDIQEGMRMENESFVSYNESLDGGLPFELKRNPQPAGLPFMEAPSVPPLPIDRAASKVSANPLNAFVYDMPSTTPSSTATTYSVIENCQDMGMYESEVRIFHKISNISLYC